MILGGSGGGRSGSGSGGPRPAGEPAEGITPNGRGYRVACVGGCSWPLDRKVNTEDHATNLLQKHVREYHADDPPPGGGPSTLDLTAAAVKVLATDRGSERGGALMVWRALTGLAEDEALAYARSLAGGRPVTAVLPPF